MEMTKSCADGELSGFFYFLVGFLFFLSFHFRRKVLDSGFSYIEKGDKDHLRDYVCVCVPVLFL